MTTKTFKILIIVQFAIVIFSCQNHDDLSIEGKFDQLDSTIERLEKNGQFNGAVLIAHNNSNLFMKTYGYTDVSKTSKLTNESSFRLASVSKNFTAMGIMILIERGQLSLDDNICNYLPKVKNEGITIRNLLNHTSGLPDYFEYAEKYRGELDILTIPDVINIFQKYPQELIFEPGSKFEYCNTNYIYLSEIISRVSEVSFEEFLKVNVFDPLSMENSSVFNLLSDPRILPNRTRGFSGKSDVSSFWMDGVSGDGAVFVSIEDSLIWCKALTKNLLVSESMWEEAITPAILTNGGKSNYGFGWFLSENSEYIEHGGFWLGARTYIYMNLITNSYVVVLDSSSHSVEMLEIAEKAKKILYSLDQ